MTQKVTKWQFIQSVKTMKKTRNLFIAFVSMALCYACTTKPANDLKKMEWLIGTWECKTEEGSSYETWSPINDKEYTGKSYMIPEKDTVIFETIRMVQEQAGLFYIPIVKDQNEGLPIRFACKMASATQFVFENRKHDFPQIITYTKIGTDSLVAEISGKLNGQVQKQTFPMKRVQ